MEKLRIGQEFEVVEVLVNWGFMMLKGKQGVIDGQWFKRFTNLGDAYLYKSEFKPIGKLRIKKLK